MAPRQSPRVREGLNLPVATHVHVHPDAVLPADVGNGDERVEGSVHRRPSGGAHEERNETLRGRRTKINPRGEVKPRPLTSVTSSYLLLGLQDSPLKVGRDHFTAVKMKDKTSI